MKKQVVFFVIGILLGIVASLFIPKQNDQGLSISVKPGANPVREIDSVYVYITKPKIILGAKDTVYVYTYPVTIDSVRWSITDSVAGEWGSAIHKIEIDSFGPLSNWTIRPTILRPDTFFITQPYQPKNAKQISIIAGAGYDMELRDAYGLIGIGKGKFIGTIIVRTGNPALGIGTIIRL